MRDKGVQPIRLATWALAALAAGMLAAAALLITAPVLLLTLTVQRHIVASLAAGGLKG